MITPKDFVERWGQSALREQQAAQSHFNELCQLVGHKTPTELDPEGKFFTFEEQVTKATGGKGRADVWLKGNFAWEYKGKHRDLDAAYSQLSAYRGALGNPPLLVVCDFLEYRIYPQWTNTSGLPFVFKNDDLLLPETRRYILWLLESPDKFLELRQTELEAREKLTLKLAEQFAHLADLMREHTDADGKHPWQPIQIARFLTKLVFAFFCEDVDILPRPFNQPAFRYIIEEGVRKLDHEEERSLSFIEIMTMLFGAMNGDRGTFIMKPSPYFNGGIFAPSKTGAGDELEILDITVVTGAIELLYQVNQADWRFVNPTIFGTLFEGALDVNKRAQLGAHYTGEADIRLVVEPVLMQPLYRQWEAVRAEAEPLLQTYLHDAAPRKRAEAQAALTALHDRMMSALEQTTVLDPACGSGNFLYMSLRALKDLEGRVRKFFEPLALPFRDVVTPRQLYGIEKDEFAANLAKVVVWIGYLQWRYEDEGILHPVLLNRQPHPRALPHPIIKDKNHPDEPDRIVCEDAILRRGEDGKAYEPEWPAVDVIMGNPPFLGDKRMRSEMEAAYVDELRALYRERVPGSADLVTYWFEKARAKIAVKTAKRAGLLSTQSIRTGASRTVLDRIKETGDIFMAWSDKAWTLEGAAVRISIVGFDDGTQKDYCLDNVPVTQINSDLQNSIDATKARPIASNRGFAFQGPVKVGAFDISEALAKTMLAAHNPSGVDNSDVVKPILNGNDIVQKSRNQWIIDFGLMTEEEASRYEQPFGYVVEHVKPERLENRDKQRATHWWRLGRSGDDYKQFAKTIKRQIFTPRVAKHRIFIWADANVLPDSRVYAICRDDDYFFGVLHSYIHEKWAIRLASWHGDGNEGGRPTYVASTCFDTFPFPWSPGKEDAQSPQYAVISAAAKALHEERAAWLNPPEWATFGVTPDSKTAKERTLTNLYNALDAYRVAQSAQVAGESAVSNGNGNGEKLVKAARDFAPRLAALHDALDQAVLAAYGWDDLAGRLRTPDGEEEMLRRLLALNLARG